MSLLQSTLFGAFFLLPGVFSLAIALSPKGRAIRPSSLSTRAVGLVTFAVLDWFFALLLYSSCCSDGRHGEHLASLLIEGDDIARKQILGDLLTFPSAVWRFLGLLTLWTIATGGAFAVLQNAAITGLAIRDFKLKCLSPSWPRQEWFRFSRRVEICLAWLNLSSLVAPIGASYWLVIEKASKLMTVAKEDDPGVVLVYADVLQGEEEINGNIGVLYTGVVKHLVCETDGNIVFLLLRDAARWSFKKNGWKPIQETEAFALEGQSIRNISFRLTGRTGSVQPTRWPESDSAPSGVTAQAPAAHSEDPGSL